MSKNTRHYGFTLIELMITLALAAILMGLAAPAFRDFIQNNRAATQANSLVSAINLARSEAVSKGMQVVLCPANNAQDGCSGDWTNGWIVFLDLDRSGTPGDSSNILRVWGPPAGNPTLTGPADLRYRPQGQVANAGTFNLTLPDCQGDQKREIEVNVVGRPNVERSACP